MSRDPIRNPILRESLRQLLPLVRPIFEQIEFSYHLWQQIEDKTEYQRCVQLMKDDPTIGKHLDQLVGTSSGGVRTEAGTFISRFFGKVYEVRVGNHFERFDAVYQEFEDFFFKDSLEFELISPLVNFTLEGTDLDLGNNIRTTPLPADIRASLARLPIGPVVSRDYLEMIGTEFCLYSTVVEKKIIGGARRTAVTPKHVEAEERILRLLQCMRLFQPGAIGSAYTLRRIKGWTPLPAGFAWRSGSVGSWRGPAPYKITAEKRDELARFSSWCDGALAGTSRDVALANRRFNFSYERGSREDALIDLVIALEALFLGGEPGEFAYRLGMRVAGLLGTTREDRQKTFEFISFAYSQRSKIVHGGEVPKQITLPNEGTLDFASFVSRLEDYLRGSIRRVLEIGLARRERIKELERRILSGPEVR